ncbi:hypothetical protein GCM10010421_06210 [Streptomyces glaucus]|uniref:Secreted protein n=1 Tax=Streptomyces glaucus TaxID=284029 RepID=A0ABN3J7G5_9ACTN
MAARPVGRAASAVAGTRGGRAPEGYGERAGRPGVRMVEGGPGGTGLDPGRGRSADRRRTDGCRAAAARGPRGEAVRPPPRGGLSSR